MQYGDYSGFDEYIESLDEATRRANTECQLRYWNDLWILWDLIRVNPNAEDFDTLIADCLVRNDLADESLTGRQFREALNACGALFEHDPDQPFTQEEIDAILEAVQDCRPQLPGPAYLDEGVAWDCQMDPLNN